MQIVKPVDIEDALRVDMAALVPKASHCAPPAPDDLAAETVCYTRVGGTGNTPVSHYHDLSVDVWAEDEQAAMELACEVQGNLSALPLRELPSGLDYKDAVANVPYNNPDPNRPMLARATFTATVTLRGESIL